VRLEKAKKLIGKKDWKEFEEYMNGQTVGIYPDGTTNFYECDVEQFLECKKRKVKPFTND